MDIDTRSGMGRQTVAPLPPKLLIATRVFGASGQPWMWRQVAGLDGFRKELVCWERQNASAQPTVDVLEHVLPCRQAPYHNEGRWLYRCRAIFAGSFYAAIGAERVLLRRLFEDGRPDAILCNFGDIAMRLLPTAQAAGIPLVAYFHGDFSFLHNRWYRWSLYRCMNGFAAIVVVTQDEREWLTAHGVARDRIHYLPCGAPTDLFRPPTVRLPGPTRFVMVSRLSEEKGCDISIEAFASVAALAGPASLDIFGDGECRAALERQVQALGLGDKVAFHGYVGEGDLAARLPRHDVFIQHSRIKEGSPVSVVEAMACGLPVVATRIGGIADQVEDGETGFLVDPGDLGAMTEAMLSLARDPLLRARMGEAGRRRAVQRHDAAKQTAALGALLKAVCHAAHGV